MLFRSDALCPGTPVVALVYPTAGTEEDPVCAAALVEKTGDLRPLVQALLGVLNLNQNRSGKKADSSAQDPGPDQSQG